MSENGGTIQSRLRFSQFGRGLGVAIMAVVLLGSDFARAQIDPADPWPKFGQNVRNTCRSPNRGPHSLPQLRWWAEAGVGLAPPGYDGDSRGGAAIAKIEGVRYVFVPGNLVIGTPPNHSLRPVLRIFRFHPCGTYDPQSAQAPYLAQICINHTCGYDPDPAEIVVSTPLVFRVWLPESETDSLEERIRVVVQTTNHVYCYDVTDLKDATCNYTPTISQTAVWKYPSDDEQFRSTASSATIGRVFSSGMDETARIYVIGTECVSGDCLQDPEAETTRDLFLVALDPEAENDGEAFAWHRNLGPFEPTGSGDLRTTPAMGPPSSGSVNLVYVSFLRGESTEHAGALLAELSGDWTRTRLASLLWMAITA